MRRLRNVTITVDEEVVRWARIKAAEENTSVSRLLGGVLRQMIRQHQRFHSAKREFQRLDTAIISDGAYPRREDLQDGQDLDGVLVVNPFLHAPELSGTPPA